MTTNAFRKRLLGAGSALRVLALIGAGATAGIVAAPAAAQNYTAGAVSGTVTDEAGNTIQGATVTLTSSAQGVSRTSTTSAGGGFRFASIPTGNYELRVEAAGQDAFVATDVRVVASQTTDLNVALTAPTGNEIVVSASTIVSDFAGTNTGLVVDIDELVKRVPLARDLTSVILLAPGTTQGDDTFGNLASIGGSSVAENAYYLNGLNITNFDNYVGGARVPFEFYSSIDVKSGGYSAEFGRATGGIVNAVSKSGSNEFTAAMHLNWEPNFLREQGKDLFDSQGQISERRLERESEYSAILEMGGPIVKDRLFVYGLVEFREDKNLTTPTRTIARQDEQNDPFWAVKVDAYPFDNHHLELTVFDTRRSTQRTDYNRSTVEGAPTIGDVANRATLNYGGLNYVGQYTGTFTDWLTVSAAYGVNEDRFDQSIESTDAYVINSASDVDGNYFGVPFGGFYTGQTLSGLDFPYSTKREFYRGDVDLYFSLFGDHHIRAGFDVENNSLEHVTVRTGADTLLGAGLLTTEAYNALLGNGGYAILLQEDGQVELNYYNTGGSFKAKNKSFYIQDEWNLTDRLTLNLGLRRDDFTQNRADGETLVNLDKNYGLRLGATYNMWDDGSGTLFGSFSEYYLPFASNTAYRQGSVSYYLRERFQLAGIDANGLPILGEQVNQVGDNSFPGYNATCPFALTPQSSGVNCLVSSDGEVPDTTQAISSNLKATKETEYIIGYRHNFNVGGFLDQFTVGLSYTRRELNRTAEDSAIDGAVRAYCDTNGIAGCDEVFSGTHQYVINNPGQDITVALLDTENTTGLNGQVVTLSAEDLGYGDAVRKYDAVELTFDRPFDGKWSLGGSYVWSKSRGNSEGYVNSDLGQDDAGITQDFDMPGLVDYAYGYLPNDRRHRFRLFGGYAVTENILLGSNVRVDSPRPLSCFGFHPTDLLANNYGAASHFCGLEPSPRGTAQKSDWQYNVDLSARYVIDLPTGQNVTLRADVFNVFNSQAVTSRNEDGDSAANNDEDTGLPTSVTANPNYGYALGYQTPRYARLGVDVSF